MQLKELECLRTWSRSALINREGEKTLDDEDEMEDVDDGDEEAVDVALNEAFDAIRSMIPTDPKMMM